MAPSLGSKMENSILGDHIEATMGLSTFGHYKNAEKAFLWLFKNQNKDGSWYAHYFSKNEKESQKIDTNFTAYCATGLWHYYLCSKNEDVLIKFYDMLNKAINFVINQQHDEGDIQWALSDIESLNEDALITACSSIYKSLECALKINKTLGKENTHWNHAYQKLGNALIHKPHRFDRTWESKERFSMDWFYPILANVYTQKEAQEILHKKWHIFIEDTFGCRCVSDEPWMTVAETCEFIMALNASGDKVRAEGFLSQLQQWQDTDGGFWTGYNFKHKNIWPEEKTTWTSGAFILATDSLYNISSASNLFSISETV